MGNKVIDPVGLREELKVLTLDKLKEKYVEYGIEDLWKNGTNKAIAVDIAVKAITEKNSAPAEEEKPEDQNLTQDAESTDSSIEDNEEDYIEPGEYEVDQDTLDEYPALVDQGFNVGDTLVVEEGKPWYKKEVEEPYSESEEGTKNIGTQKSIEDADAEIKGDNANIKEGDITDLNDDPSKGPWKEVDGKLLKDAGESVDPNQQPIVEEDEEEILDGNEVVKEYVPEVIDESLFTGEDILENIEICQANLKDALPATRITLLRKIEALEAALERKRK